ncbi:hypothetical protein [Streptomyces sp. NPDC088554]|uniref:hypothetical protein n=1 Tax=Streptomyces sp. NPDC088554 TaxID=3365865 RepID=UPI00382EFB16
MEIVETDHEPGSAVIPTNVRVNGVDVGLLARVPKIQTGADEATTVTLVLIPSSVEVKGDHVREENKAIGFTAG